MAEPEELAPNPSAQTDLDTEALNSGRVTLADLSAKGTAEYSQKNYEKAAEYYADAAALQAELHGEMDPQNAEILYLYGRALFRVGQQKSDILGDRASGEKKANGSAMKQKSTTGDDARPEESEDGVEVKPKDEEDVAKAVIEASGGSANGKSAEIKKPLFQFTGDENFEDSDEEVVSIYANCGCYGVNFILGRRWRRGRRGRRSCAVFRNSGSCTGAFHRSFVLL